MDIKYWRNLLTWTGLSSPPIITKEVKKTIPKPIKVPWHTCPKAWAFIYVSNQSYWYLKRRSFSRKGYLIGSDSSCDIKISDPRIQPRHCLIYYENYKEINNEYSIRVYLKDLSDSQCPTLISVKGQIVKKNPNQPIRLLPNDLIHFLYPKSPKENLKVFGFTIMLSPNMVIKSFKEEYKLGPVLGQGFYATVNKVSRNKKLFAVKQIRKDKFKYQPKALEQFTREISILMSLEYHPGIVGIINVYDERDTFQIVMEYICEGNLLSFINDKGKLSEQNAKIIFKQLLFSVKFLHDVGIVHRDLKPENIMVESRKKLKVKICDFGLATLHCSLSELTTACGSRNYVAPEILSLPQYKTNTTMLDLKEPTVSYGKECDLWSLGVILYVCLSRTFPFNRKGNVSERKYILLGQFEFSHHVWKSISVEAKDLITCLLKVDANERITAKDALNHPWMIKS